MRGAADCQKSVIFLYSSKKSAEESKPEGASGFIVGIPSNVDTCRDFYYAVTNRHVIENGCSVIRINAIGGGTDIIDLKPTDWLTSKTDDLAACEIPFDLSKHDAEVIGIDWFLTPEDIKKYKMGPGMECFVVGRFVAYPSKRNQPAARFGAVSMLEPQPVKRSDNHIQESFLVEMHSISGYSGSPVYIYLSPHTPGTDLTHGWEYKAWLLGVDWGHIPKLEPVVDRRGNPHPDGWRVQLNSGMMGVVPCWRLLDLLNREEFLKIREQDEKAALEDKEHAGVLDTATDDDPGVFTKEDFENALKKVSKKIEPKK